MRAGRLGKGVWRPPGRGPAVEAWYSVDSAVRADTGLADEARYAYELARDLHYLSILRRVIMISIWVYYEGKHGSEGHSRRENVINIGLCS